MRVKWFERGNPSKEFRRKDSTQVFLFHTPDCHLYRHFLTTAFAVVFFVLACKNSRWPPDEKDGKAARMQNKRTVDNLRNIRILQLV